MQTVEQIIEITKAKFKEQISAHWNRENYEDAYWYNRATVLSDLLESFGVSSAEILQISESAKPENA